MRSSITGGLPSSRSSIVPDGRRYCQHIVCQAGGDKGAGRPRLSKQIFKNLQDFGIGKTSFVEGGIGLLVGAGVAGAFALMAVVRAASMRTDHPYNVTVELPLACGITLGTPVRMRGVQVGQVQHVKPSLDRVDVHIEMKDVSNVIPRNSEVLANQSGLIAEPLLDIYPRDPLPVNKFGPKDAECEREGLIVCENGRILGDPGVALDDLVYLMTKIARKAEKEDSAAEMFAAAEAATRSIEEARPLMKETLEMLEEVTPLLKQLREEGLGDSIEALTRAAAEAVEDIKDLQSAVLTPDNVMALKQSVKTLTRSLDSVQSVTAMGSKMSRSSGTGKSLSTVVSALSRLVDE